MPISPKALSCSRPYVRLPAWGFVLGYGWEALGVGPWTYRHPPRTGKLKHYVLEKLPTSVKDIAWKAQTRLCARYRVLSSRGKQLTVAVTAVARELAGLVWAIGREVKPA